MLMRDWVLTMVLAGALASAGGCGRSMLRDVYDGIAVGSTRVADVAAPPAATCRDGDGVRAFALDRSKEPDILLEGLCVSYDDDGVITGKHYSVFHEQFMVPLLWARLLDAAEWEVAASGILNAGSADKHDGGDGVERGAVDGGDGDGDGTGDGERAISTSGVANADADDDHGLRARIRRLAIMDVNLVAPLDDPMLRAIDAVASGQSTEAEDRSSTRSIYSRDTSSWSVRRKEDVIVLCKESRREIPLGVWTISGWSQMAVGGKP